MIYITIIVLFFATFLNARETGQTEITTEEGIEVFKQEKYYLLKKNVIILSDEFELRADLVKAFFDKDLYDITKIESKKNVVLNSSRGINASGSEIDFSIVDEVIKIKGEKSLLINKEMTMRSDGLIDVNNYKGIFKINGLNSNLKTSEVDISGYSIRGEFIEVNGQNEIQNLYVNDDNQINIKTETLNMFGLKAIYNKKDNIIELFDNVSIIRDNESISGDYAKINTLTESYKVTSKNSEKVKVLLNNTNE